MLSGSRTSEGGMMPCISIPHGFLCLGNEPVVVAHGTREYLFEWTEACGWLPVNRDRSERISPVPDVVWEKLERQYPRKPQAQGDPT